MVYELGVKKKRPWFDALLGAFGVDGEADLGASLFPERESMLLGGASGASALASSPPAVGEKKVTPWTRQQWAEWEGTRATMAARKKKRATLLGEV